MYEMVKKSKIYLLFYKITHILVYVNGSILNYEYDYFLKIR
jgi:hypothetical protein